MPEVPQWWIKDRHLDLQRGNLTSVLPLKWTRERMKTDRPHHLGFMKAATLFFPNAGKMGAWNTCLLFHCSSSGSFGEDALLKGEKSMAALTGVFSCGLRRIRHSSCAVIYLSYLRHCPQSHKCKKADFLSPGKAKSAESIIKNCLNSWHLCLPEKLQKGRGDKTKVLFF